MEVIFIIDEVKYTLIYNVFTLEPDRCRPIAVGMLGRDLLLLLAKSSACVEAMAEGPTNLASKPGPLIADTGFCGFTEV